MIKKQNGEISLSTTKEQVEHWDKILDEYETSVGLGKYSDIHNFTEDEQLSQDTWDEQSFEDYYSSQETEEENTGSEEEMVKCA